MNIQPFDQVCWRLSRAKRPFSAGQSGVARSFASIVVGIILLGLGTDSAPAGEHFYRPAPYVDVVIYLFGSDPGGPRRPSAEYVRQHATKVISLGVRSWEKNGVTFWDELRWENARNDPGIKRRTGPLTMVIDLYNRIQPNPPEKPRFESLYGTKRFLYSEECDYLELKPPLSTWLDSFLKD